MKKYKDQCDICNKWDYCKGHNGLVLCHKCLERELIKDKNKSLFEIVDKEIKVIEISKNQTTIFDFL